MRCIAIISHGPNWLEGRSVYEQGEPITAHLAAMSRRYDEGTLLLGGPFTDGHGGIAVLEVVDEDAARALMDADPAVAAGVMTYRLQTLRAYFDAFAHVRTTSSVDELARQAAPEG